MPTTSSSGSKTVLQTVAVQLPGLLGVFLLAFIGLLGIFGLASLLIAGSWVLRDMVTGGWSLI